MRVGLYERRAVGAVADFERIDKMRAPVTWVVCFAFVGIVLHARDARADDELPLLLARTCVAEIGFDGDVSECELMWVVNQQNAFRKQRSLKRQTLLFNSYWKCRAQRSRRPWIKHLKGYKAPKYWPKTMRWENFRDKWILIETAAVKFAFKRRAPTSCTDAMDYGAVNERPKMGGVEPVDCGKTLQRYWRFKK